MKRNDDINLVWTSIVLVIGLIWFVRPLIMQENAYRRVEGEIVSSFVGGQHYHIVLSTSNTHYRANRSHRDVLQEKAVVGRKATIWYRLPIPHPASSGEIFIVKMIVDDEVVIPFSRGIGVSLIFIGVLLAPLIAIIIHFVKKGRKRENEIEDKNN